MLLNARSVDGDECSGFATRQAGHSCPAKHFRRGWKASAIHEAPLYGRDFQFESFFGTIKGKG
jgi:hypothetical protein